MTYHQTHSRLFYTLILSAVMGCSDSNFTGSNGNGLQLEDSSVVDTAASSSVDGNLGEQEESNGPGDTNAPDGSGGGDLNEEAGEVGQTKSQQVTKVKISVKSDTAGTCSLQVAELSLKNNGKEIQKTGTASQSSTIWQAQRGNDGNKSGNASDNSVSRTGYQTNPWWQVEFASPKTITEISYYFRTVGNYSSGAWGICSGFNEPLDKTYVELFDSSGKLIWSRRLVEGDQPWSIDGKRFYGRRFSSIVY